MLLDNVMRRMPRWPIAGGGWLAVGLSATAAILIAGTLARPHLQDHGPSGHVMTAQVSSSAGENAAARPRTIQTPVACEKLPNVPGKSITTLLVEFPPNAFTPQHRHPGSVTAYVLKGTLRSQLNGGPVETFRVGATWFEPPGTVHNMVENASLTTPAEILAIFVADSDCGALTVFDD